jgi:transposase InsO family protein
MSVISQFGADKCRRPTLAELQCIVGFSTIGAPMYTETDNQTGAFVDTTKLSNNGSRLICKSAGVGWIVAPSTTEVARNWYCRNDAVLEAQRLTQTCCTQWFVPTVSQLQNPGHCCRTFWDSFSCVFYWSSTENCSFSSTYGCGVNFSGGAGAASPTNKNSTCRVRAFRCVTY